MNVETHPVLTCAEAVELEKRVLKSDPALEWKAMLRAGSALGREVLKDYRETGELPARLRLLVLAGKGHNSGDVFIAAREIMKQHPDVVVDVLFALGEQSLNSLAARAWRDLLGAADRDAITPLAIRGGRDAASELREKCGGHYHICLDGIFGMNFRPPFRGSLSHVVEWMNKELKAEFRAAVDMPSGLGDEPSDLAFRADFTYMTGSAKLPLFLPQNAAFAGRLRYLDLGFFESEEERAKSSRGVILPKVLKNLRRLRDPMAHKRKLGHLLIVGGSRLMPGAILMSIMAAARSGVGLLTAAVPESLLPAFATVVPEAMWIACPETESGGLSLDSLHRIERGLTSATAMLLGPGVGTEVETQAFLENLVQKAELPMVIDAEALQPEVIARLGSAEKVRGRVVVTPHAGEYHRISGRDFYKTGEDGLLEFCRETGLLVLLKGPPFTRVCDGSEIVYALSGGPVMARGGSGDLLGGLVGGLLAREPGEVARGVRRAIVWQGMAADAWAREMGQEAVRTTQLLDFLPGVLREERN